MDSVAVIPAYNVGRSIREVVERTLLHVDRVVVVDDGSTDDTASEAREGGAHVISLERNTGKAFATKIGLKECIDHKVVVLLDGDLQHCPEEIPRLVEEVTNGTDLCIGSRFLDGGIRMPFANRISNRIASNILSFLSSQQVSDPQSGFRALSGSVAQSLELRAERYSIEHIMILEAAEKNLRIKEVPISCIYGDEESQISLVSDTLRVMQDILRFVFRR